MTMGQSFRSNFSWEQLRDIFVQGLGNASFSKDSEQFLKQAFDDIRMDDLPNLETLDLGYILAKAWLSGERVHFDASGRPKPLIQLDPAQCSTGEDLDLDILTITQIDSPFLVDSVMGELAEMGLDLRAMFHPVVSVSRNSQGLRVDSGQAQRESIIVVVLASVGQDRRQKVIESVAATLEDVHFAVNDFNPMRKLLYDTAQELKTALLGSKPVALERWLKARGDRAPKDPKQTVEEYLHFLKWLEEDHFVFLGARVYDYPRLANGDYAPEEPIDQQSFGVLKDTSLSVLRRASEPALLTSALKGYLETSPPLMIAKANLRSRVHRHVYMDYIGVKRYAPDGAAVGEIRFVGLFTAEAYDETVRDIPFIRHKIAHIFARASQNPSAYSEKRLRNIIETYPRDEIFQAEEDEIYEIAMGILHLYDRLRTRLFVRPDPLDRFISVLVFIPKDRYTSKTREKVGLILAEAFGGRVSAAYPSFGVEPLARVHYVLGVTPAHHKTPDLHSLEQQVDEATRSWWDQLAQRVRHEISSSAVVERGKVGDFLTRYAEAFPPGYQDHYDTEEALKDAKEIDGLDVENRSLRVRAFRLDQDSLTTFRFKIYHRHTAVPLSDVMPILENMGLKAIVEDGFPVRRAGYDPVWVHEFVLNDPRGEAIVFEDVKQSFEAAFLAIWQDLAENDGFNRLVIEIGLNWREAALIRALSRYRQQTGLDPSTTVQQAALQDFPAITRQIMELFAVKFDPDLGFGRERRLDLVQSLSAAIFDQLQKVDSLDYDRVLRRITQLILSLKRTNFYQKNIEGQAKPYISFKISSRELEDLPLPKPYCEIFVAAPHVEGVHLRFGPVARGGLRWSDRRDDFRTEVLSLVKAQQVKNSVIVPVGSKGGFYPKQLPKEAGSEAWRAEGVRAYKTFLCGLLDLTDNLGSEGEVLTPPGLVVYDGDDPYLVVAADKGTATFSDIANDVAKDYGFWLGDAFASGGSVGYDHKAMGITARGAWEAVKRHFREIGKDIQKEPFTCVGVGDMSGDVFGNGMLLSKATQLVAAFDHRHIFLDPNPDPDISFAERQRLFALPRSSWEDYNLEYLSPGGGIFPRHAKSIPISPEVQACLDISGTHLSPQDLIRAILQARVELLYLGGIGTYVKAASESHAEAGDKANDAIRINAEDLRVAVVGEGANLGFTQKARIAFARRSGRINTDAIDNSAGVDTSDHEVNIKILTGRLERLDLLDRPKRDKLLAEMTDDVARHVLAHNYAQTLSLSLQEHQAVQELEAQAQFITNLEIAGKLDRKVEFLPSASELQDLKSQGKGLVRPELAVISAYGKLDLDAALVASSAPDDPWFNQVLVGYFPKGLRRFEAQMPYHRLRREIIATRLSNQIVDMAGPTFVSRLMAATGAGVGLIAKCFFAVREIFHLGDLWARLDSLDLVIPSQTQMALYIEIAALLRKHVYGLVKRRAGLKDGDLVLVEDLIATYREAVLQLHATGSSLFSSFECDQQKARIKTFLDQGTPEELVQSLVNLGNMSAVFDIADLAAEMNLPVVDTARLYYNVGAVLGYDRLQTAASNIRLADRYERAALRGVINDLEREQAQRARTIINLAKKGKPVGAMSGELDNRSGETAIAAWIQPRKPAVDYAHHVIEDIEAAGEGWSFAKLALAHGALRQIV